MREAEFRDWLEAGGAQSAKAIQGRISALRRMENKLVELDLPFASLDEAFAADGFVLLLAKLTALREDAKNGGFEFRVLLPESKSGDSRLSYWQSWLRRYGRFLNGNVHEPVVSNDELDILLARLTRAEVVVAIEECDEDGVAAFLQNRGFNRPQRWIKDDQGQDRYPAKAIVAAAVSYLPDGPDLNAHTFYGGFGEFKAFSRLEGLGYDITPAASATLTREAVEAAMDECDGLGLDGFLTRYAFGMPRDYWVLRPDSGTRYPAKAIAGVAHRHIEGGKVLANSEFYGGDGSRSANTMLRALGFEIVGAEDALGTAPQARMTDRIRQFLIDHYIAPARSRGEAEVEIVSGTVHTEMGLNDAKPNVCQVLDGKIFAEEAGVELIGREGPRASSTVRYRFALRAGNRVRETAGAFQTMPEPTNLILYGPPGTGKTYATAREAVMLCDGFVPDDRAKLMARYAELREQKRIEFVTFHQNFSYEDFVEGLRPPVSGSADASDDAIAPSAGGGLSLIVHPGIFRDIAQRAELDRGAEVATTLDPQRSVFKIALGQRGIEEADIAAALDAGVITLGWGGFIDWSAPKFEDFNEVLKHWRAEQDTSATGKDPNVELLSALRGWIQEGDYVVVSDGRDRFRAIGEVTGPYTYHPDVERHPHRRTVRWLWRDDTGLDRGIFYPKPFRGQPFYRLDPLVIDWAALAKVVDGGNAATSAAAAPRPHVLIIDEINRANISKVFGELITLIEPDKRLGKANALTVRLPYSKREFGVPANLHIVGTMNTADRSIALLDTALRRRFRFQELAPDTAVPAFLAAQSDTGVPLVRVLEAINDRIEYLIDRDHRIGHAFFIGCRTRDDVDGVMRDKVIPLLQEYFFEDWRNIAAVLGKGFIEETSLKPPPGLENARDKSRWAVRKTFAADAFDILLGKAAMAPEPLAETPFTSEPFPSEDVTPGA